MIQNKYYNLSKKNKKKVALLADIHYSDIFKLVIFEKIIDNIKINKPDYICIPGDIIDDGECLDSEIVIQPLLSFLKELSKIAPVIISIGNHDYKKEIKKNCTYIGTKKLKKYLSTIKNVYLLDNQILELDGISFFGLTNSFEYYYNKKHENIDMFIDELKVAFYNKIYRENYNILLCHTPINIMEDKVIDTGIINNIDLILSGHFHNGMVPRLFDKIKGNRGLLGPFYKILPKYARGIVTKKINNKNVNLVIAGGVLKISKTHAKVIRFANVFYPISIDYINI